MQNRQPCLGKKMVQRHRGHMHAAIAEVQATKATKLGIVTQAPSVQCIEAAIRNCALPFYTTDQFS